MKILQGGLSFILWVCASLTKAYVSVKHEARRYYVCGYLPNTSVVLDKGKFYSLGEKMLKAKTFTVSLRKK